MTALSVAEEDPGPSSVGTLEVELVEVVLHRAVGLWSCWRGLDWGLAWRSDWLRAWFVGWLEAWLAERLPEGVRVWLEVTAGVRR